MSHPDEQLSRLFEQAFDDRDGPDPALWDTTRASMYRRLRARRAVTATSVVVAAAALLVLPQVLLADRDDAEIDFADRPDVEEEAGPQTPEPTETAAPEPDPEPDPETPSEPEEDRPPPSPEPQGDTDEGSAAAPTLEVTDWYALSLHEEVDADARYFSARQALDALVAAMTFSQGSQVSHQVSEASETQATGRIQVSELRDDSLAAEEIRVRIRRDDEGWYVDPDAQARATCRRGVGETDRTRCL